MFKTRRFWVTGLTLLFAAGCGPKELRVEMAYTPTSRLAPGDIDWIVPGTKVALAKLEDRREQTERLGENVEEDPAIPVYEQPQGSTVGVIEEALGKELREMGLVVVEDPSEAARALHVTLTKAFISEGSTYKGDVRLIVEVTDGAGNQVLNTMAAGTSSRFGSSLSAVNYRETLGDAFVDALRRLLKDPRFRAAINGTEMPAGAEVDAAKEAQDAEDAKKGRENAGDGIRNAADTAAKTFGF
jgi:hypothetical protein